MANSHDSGHTQEGPTGLWSWITTTDHKRIGIMYGATAFFFLLVGGLEALLIRTQLAKANNTFVDADTFNQLFTMHGTTMVFLALMPMSAAFFNFIIPLQIGARDVAFPRLNAFSYWVFLLGGIFINASFLIGAAPDAGWFGYANLTSTQFSPGLNVDFWGMGLQILGIASLAAAFNFIATIINMRAPGMKLMRMPVFTWMSFVTQILVVTAFPVITVALVFLMFDRMFGTTFYSPAAGGDLLLWQHLFWLFGHPEVYILILPTMGMVSEVLPTFSRKPLFGYAVVVYSGALIGGIGWAVWSHHMFASGMGAIADTYFAVATMLIAIPTGVKIFNWMATMWGGQIRFTTSMLFAIAFIMMFTIGGISGVMHASAPSDLQQTDTYFIVAHFHYVLFGGAMMGIFSAMYYWWPKVFGKLMSEGLGKVHFWITFVGLNLTFFPMHFIGMLGMPRRVYTYGPELGLESMNYAATLGSFLIGIGTLVMVFNILKTWKGPKQDVGKNPWGAATLEWAISSPPPVYNFSVIPEVRSRLPLWTEDGMSEVPDVPPEPVHVPGGSYWPLVTSFGLVGIFVGAIAKSVPIAAIAAVVLVVGIFKWGYEPFEM
ncbi:MAG: cytochrome c oxidase subunit I [Gemmatimonadota bacterium]|nr:cytochrome c oxidase subunit I [Gemmatimonadota bacterium]MDH5804714.1 cytochrome c oxidase subunit I [Gemmatimonadota bacterium]